MKCALAWCEDASGPDGGYVCRWHARALVDLRERYDRYMSADHNGEVEPLEQLDAPTRRLILAALDVGITARSFSGINPLIEQRKRNDEAQDATTSNA